MSSKILNVLFVSAESRPFASTGGLADVAEALPNELNRGGLHVERIMPLYRRVMEGQGDRYQLERTPHRLEIPLGSAQVTAEVWAADLDGTRTYFVGREEYFDRSELYALPHREYSDNFERFCFFQKAVVALIDGLGRPYDVLHLNDWQTGLIPSFLRHGISGTGRDGNEGTLYTIHNLAYQGVYSAARFYETNLPGSLSSHPEMEFYGQINMMKAGIANADLVNTVSPRYAEEIQTPEFGCGLEGLLSSLPQGVKGIVNGVDYQAWNPEKDDALTTTYSADSLAGKEECKKEILKEFGLEYKKDQPLFGLISRLVDQKGLDLIAGAIEQLMALPVQFVLLGSGQAEYQEMAKAWEQRWPEKFAANIGYDVGQSHRIEAGCDFFLMPSRFEPCGLNQLYSLRYGSLPIVSCVGGLADTVVDLRLYEKDGTGFVMGAYTPESFMDSIRAAIGLFHDKTKYRSVRKRAMKQDFSWKKTGEEYISLFKEISSFER